MNLTLIVINRLALVYEFSLISIPFSLYKIDYNLYCHPIMYAKPQPNAPLRSLTHYGDTV